MFTLLRIDAETLPRILVLDPPMTDEEFEALCRENDAIQLERTKEGAIRMLAPAGGWTSRGNQEIARQLGNWGAEHEHGYVFDSSGGFRLPDGSTLRLTTDLAWANTQSLLIADRTARSGPGHREFIDLRFERQ